MTRKTTPSTSAATSSWDDLLRLVPGYDPFAGAGACTFDEDAATRAIGFFGDCLTHVKGQLAGQSFLLEPWQRSIVANIFGWKRPDGTRRYREALKSRRWSEPAPRTAYEPTHPLPASLVEGALPHPAAGSKDQREGEIGRILCYNRRVGNEQTARSRCSQASAAASSRVDVSASGRRGSRSGEMVRVG